MKNLFSKNSIYLLGAIIGVLVTGCQWQSSVDPILANEVTPTQTPSIETTSPTPSPTPDHQVGTSKADNLDSPFPYEQVDEFGKAKLDKLSGIVFYPPQETLFAVTDNGRIVEIKTDGAFIRQKDVRKKTDFEGITYSPVTERLYVAVEGDEVILEVNPETFEAERDIVIDRMFEGDILLSAEGDGIEGITFVPARESTLNGSFYLVNQSKKLGGADPSIVFEVEIDHAASEPRAGIIRYFSVGVTDLSGIHYNPSNQRLLIISDANDLLLEVSLTGQVLATYPLPGEKQEGITTDGNGFLYIVQDTKKAPLKFIPLDDAKE